MTTRTAVYKTPTLRLIESQAIAQHTSNALILRAGGRIAQRTVQWLQERKLAQPGAATGSHSSKPQGRILCLVGPGHNGADALAAAKLLAEAGLEVSALLVPSFFMNLKALPEAAQSAFTRLPSSVVKLHAWPAAVEGRPGEGTPDVIIDGLLGLGSSRAPESPIKDWIASANACDALRVAIDVPTGLNADTGRLFGDTCFMAHKTIAMLGALRGLFTADGPEYSGQVVVEPLSQELDAPGDAYLIEADQFTPIFKPRSPNTHKGVYGDVWVLGGATGMAGAVLLSARTALMCGAGRVYAGLLDSRLIVDPQFPELMLRDAHDAVNSAEADHAVIAVGPGMGQDKTAARLLEHVWHSTQPVVIDADGLNLLPAIHGWNELRTTTTVLTPHPLEAARLLKCDKSQVQANRFEAAQQISQRYGCWTVLKGKGTIVCSPQLQMWINTIDSPSLATAGSGDVLTGCIASLLAQGYEPQVAVCGAVWLHGSAGAALEHEFGTHGVTASQIAWSIRAQRHLFEKQSY